MNAENPINPNSPTNAMDDWNHKLTLAQEMLPLISQLHRENNAVTSIYGRCLLYTSDAADE